MALAYLNDCGFLPVAYTDVDDFAVAGPATGFFVPADCMSPASVDQATYRYFAYTTDQSQRENGYAVWDEGSQTLLRTSGVVLNSTNSGSLVTFLTQPIVVMGGPLAQDAVAPQLNAATFIEDAGTATPPSGAVNLYAKADGLLYSRDDAAVESQLANINYGAVTITAAGGVFVLSGVNWNSVSTINLVTDASAGVCSIDYDASNVPTGRVVRFNLMTLADPGDSVVIRRISASDMTAFMSSEGEFFAAQASAGTLWMPIDYSDSVYIGSEAVPTPVGQLYSDTIVGNAFQIYRVTASDVQVQLISSNLVLGSDGTGAVSVQILPPSPFVPTPAIVSYDDQPDPGDSINIDPTNFRLLDGSTPSAITFIASGDNMSIIPNSFSTLLIVGSSPGVVTP